MNLATQGFASRISGTGSAFPKKSVTNHDLVRQLGEKKIETSHDWILERTGIFERRIADNEDPQELNSSLGLLAAQRALEMAGKKAEDIDQILYATCTPDTVVPSASCLLQVKLGARRAWCMDINAACSGFLYALTTADQFIKSGQSKTALIVGAEVLSSFTNWEDRNSCILFGDAAGAVVVERTSADSSSKILASHLGSNGQLCELLKIPAGGSQLEVTAERHHLKLDKIQMKGREMFKEAVRYLVQYVEEILHRNNLKVEDIDWFISHQANLRIIEAVAKRLGLPMKKALINIDRFGNTSAATVPTVLDEAVRNQKVKPGHLILMDVFGAGVTYGSLLVRW